MTILLGSGSAGLGDRGSTAGNVAAAGKAVAISITAAGEKSSAIRAITECAVDGALRFIYQATPLFELHVNAAASGVDSNTLLGGGNADYHTGLI
jgi:hypothetical protein